MILLGMKKKTPIRILFILLFTVTMLLFFKQTRVYAANACFTEPGFLPNPFCTHYGRLCRKEGFDCSSNYINGTSESECNNSGGCFENLRCAGKDQYVCFYGKLNLSPDEQNFRCDENNGIITAIGCIPTDTPNSFIVWLFQIIVVIAGGIAFVLLAYGIFLIITSSGDPKKVQAGSELITNTLAGILFIILSLFLLRLIGVDILHLPGFGIEGGSV